MAIQLYDLLPYIIRVRDLLASGDDPDTIIQGIMYAAEQEADVTDDEIEGLSGLNDLDSVDSSYLPLWSYFLNLPFGSDWDEVTKRAFLKSVVQLYQIKGQRQSWRGFLGFYGYKRYFPWELWKSKVYEDFDYSLYRDYTHPYKAARVDLRYNIDPISYFAEGQGLDGYQGYIALDGLYFAGYGPSAAINDSVGSLVDPVRPIHVLLRRFGEPLGVFEDDAPVVVDIEPYNEAYADSIAEFAEEIELEDDLQVVTTCSGACQSGCQTFCEFSACEAVGCQTYCQGSCQTDAEYM